MQRKRKGKRATGSGVTGKLELLPEDHDPELQMPDVLKESQQAYETAGIRSIFDYFILRTFSRIFLNILHALGDTVRVVQKVQCSLLMFIGMIKLCGLM